MSNKDRNSTGNKSVWLIGGIAALIATAAIVAVASQSGGDDVVAGIEEFGDVLVEGKSLPAFTTGQADQAVGMTAPILTGKGFTGNTIVTSPGTPTLLVFLAHWCPHCQREVPLLVQWKRDGQVPDGLDVIAITTSSDPASPNFPPSEWLAREEFPALWPVMTDSGEKTAANAMGVSGFPFFVLVDAQGKVALRLSGEIEMAALTEQINKALGT
ncbi:MAG: TlpA family protein disulfide reductase [Actinobacteria bacterium]|nr:TlpA family protein disulfide reductase [Actinomycetota bacterium]